MCIIYIYILKSSFQFRRKTAFAKSVGDASKLHLTNFHSIPIQWRKEWADSTLDLLRVRHKLAFLIKKENTQTKKHKNKNYFFLRSKFYLVLNMGYNHKNSKYVKDFKRVT